MQFYPADWLADSVTGCSLAAQGLWINMLCIMHLSQRYGFVESEGKPIPDELMFRRCGCASVEEYRNLLAELFSAGVPSRTTEGTIYNRRMVRDQEQRDGNRERQQRHRQRNAPVTRSSQEETRDDRRETRNEKEKKTRVTKTVTPPDSRFQPFFSHAFESYRAKHGRAPIWSGKDRNGLKSLLKGQSIKSLPLERLQTLWQSYLDSTEVFTVKQGGSLAYFCSNLDKFSDGPMLAGKGNSNGRDINEAVATTMRGAIANAGKPN